MGDTTTGEKKRQIEEMFMNVDDTKNLQGKDSG